VDTQIPVFIWAPEEEGQFQPGRCSRWWLKQSLLRFEQQLGALGSRLVVRRTDDTSSVLLQLIHETGAEALYFNHLYDPISLMRDHEVKQSLLQAGVACRSYNADLLYEPWEVLDDKQQPFTSFDGFWSRYTQLARPTLCRCR
jgi:deoxyribodipyrimidine photolyase